MDKQKAAEEAKLAKEQAQQAGTYALVQAVQEKGSKKKIKLLQKLKPRGILARAEEKLTKEEEESEDS